MTELKILEELEQAQDAALIDLERHSDSEEALLSLAQHLPG